MCQTVWIQIRTDILSVLIWVQTVCKCYQQTTKVLEMRIISNHHSLGFISAVFLCLLIMASLVFYLTISCLTLCMLGNFSRFFVICRFFSKSTFLKNSLRNAITVSNSLDPDQDRHYVGPDLGPNCLQWLSADDTSRQRVNRNKAPQIPYFLKSSKMTNTTSGPHTLM